MGALLSQQPAQPRVAHRRPPPIVCTVAQIFGDRRTECVAIEESDRMTGGAQPVAQRSPQGCLAGAG
jgi:hypothetical protein